MNTTTKPGVLQAALRACEIPGSQGMLDESGRIIAFDLRKAREFRAFGAHEVAGDYQAEAERIAREVMDRQAASRKRLTPLIRRRA